MQTVMIIVGIVLCIDALALIILVLMQQSKQAGLSGAIAGSAETFFGKQKAKSYEGKLVLLTKITAAVFLVLAVAMLFIQRLA